MANNFGDFAGAFATSFAQTKMQQQEQARLNKMAKLQGQLVELQLQAAQKKQNAQTQVSDMMAGNTLGEFQIQPFAGADEMETNGGQPVQPVAPGTAQQIMPRQAPGVGEPMGIGEVMQNPEGLSAMMAAGYLDISDLIPKQSSPNRTLEMISAWEQEDDPETKALMEKAIAGGDGELDVFLKNQQARINMDILDERLQTARREREQTEKTEIEQLRGRQNAVAKTFDHIQEIQQLQESLSGTLLASGVPINDAVRQAKAGQLAFMQTLGLNPNEQMVLLQQLDEYDRLAKLYSVGVLESLQRFDLGNPTDVKFNELKKAVASGDKTAFSNLQLLADALDEMLDKAYEKQVPIEQEEEIRAWIKEIKSGKGSAANKEATPVVDANAVAAKAKEKIASFAKMTKEAIESIPAEEIMSYTEEELEAFKRRYQETR